MKCPWGCGWEGEPKEYLEHLKECPKVPLDYELVRKYPLGVPKEASAKMAKSQEDLIRTMLVQLQLDLPPPRFMLDVNEAKIFASAIFAAYTTLGKGSPRRVFVQDFAAALNRRGLLPNELVEKFCEYGYKYMER